MSQTQIVSMLPTAIGAGATFIGVTITIITLAPALIGIAKTQSSDFFSEEAVRTRLNRLLRGLTSNLVLLGVGVGSGLISLWLESSLLFWLSMASLMIGLIVLIGLSFLVGRTILDLLK